MGGFVRFDPDNWQPPEDEGEPAKAAKAANPPPTLAGLASLAGVPDDLRAGLGLLWSMAAPRGVSPGRWRQLVADAQGFVIQWLPEAIALGWTGLDLFGASTPDITNGDGLVLLLDGRRVCGMTGEFAAIEMGRGGRLYVHRKHRRGERLIWALGSRGR